MTKILVETHGARLKSCNLNETTKNKRIDYFNNDLLKNAKNISEMDNIISFELEFNRKDADELIEFIFYENKCCGNFSVNLDFNMTTNSIGVKLSTLK